MPALRGRQSFFHSRQASPAHSSVQCSGSSTSDFERRFSCVPFLSLASSSSPPSLTTGGGAATYAPFDCCTSGRSGPSSSASSMESIVPATCESLSLLPIGPPPSAPHRALRGIARVPFPPCSRTCRWEGGRAGSRFGSWLIVGTSLPVTMRWATGAKCASWPWPSRPYRDDSSIMSSLRRAAITCRVAKETSAGSFVRPCAPRGRQREQGPLKANEKVDAYGLFFVWCVTSGAFNFTLVAALPVKTNRKCCTIE
jgi:hypothetical protein